jgi:hypothetical protein
MYGSYEEYMDMDIDQCVERSTIFSNENLSNENLRFIALATLSIGVVVTASIFVPLTYGIVAVISFAALSFLVSVSNLCWNFFIYHQVLKGRIKKVFSASNKNAFDDAMENLLRFLVKFNAGARISPETTLALIHYCRAKSIKDRNYVSVAFAVQAARTGQICIVDESTKQIDDMGGRTHPYRVNLMGQEKVFKPYHGKSSAGNLIDDNITASIVSQFLETLGAPQMQMHAGPGIICRNDDISLGLSADYIGGKFSLYDLFNRRVTPTLVRQIFDEVSSKINAGQRYAWIYDYSARFSCTCDRSMIKRMIDIMNPCLQGFSDESDDVKPPSKSNGLTRGDDSNPYGLRHSTPNGAYEEEYGITIKYVNPHYLFFPPTSQYFQDAICIGLAFGGDLVRAICIPRDKKIIQQITWLQLCDVLTGGYDRKTASNILFNDGHAIGVDNEREDNPSTKNCLDNIRLVDKKMLEIFQEITEDQLRKKLLSKAVKVSEVDIICERLKMLQKHLSELKKNNHVIKEDEWEGQPDEIIFQNLYMSYGMQHQIAFHYLEFYKNCPGLPHGKCHDSAVKMLEMRTE